LSLTPCGLFHFGHGEQSQSNQLAGLAAEIKLLSGRHNTDATVEPITETVGVPERLFVNRFFF